MKQSSACKISVAAGLKVGATAVSDADGGDGMSAMEAENFQLVTVVPVPIQYIKVVSWCNSAW